MSGCPVPSQRRSSYPGEQDSPRIQESGPIWRIRSAEAARQILRERDATTQAGFLSESAPPSNLRPPLLWADGEEHRQQRSKIARFFAPKTVSTRYRELMTERADVLLADMIHTDSFELDDLAMRFSVEIAAQVVGLTQSSMAGMSARLNRLLDQPAYDQGEAGGGRSRFESIRAAVTGTVPMLVFYVRDVRPAIIARRRRPSQDVISHLIAEGYSDREILIECVVYAAAGMVTTREFISMATWHLLDDDGLRQRYLAADEPERHQILHEILRLEPIVGHLYRRTTSAITISDAGTEYAVPAGVLLDLLIRQVNADPKTVGEEPLRLRPERLLPRGIGAEVMSFGDGAHKCPGNSLAIQETDILLCRLLRLDLEVHQRPRIQWDDVIAGYALREFRLSARMPTAPTASVQDSSRR